MKKVDDYLAQLEPADRAALEHIRTTVRRMAPDAEEVWSYGMPGFKYNGHYLLGFAGFMNHLSLFPTGGPVQALKQELGDFKLSSGTIQFTADKPIPRPLLHTIIQMRLDSLR
ncbi:MAG TPA: DUF1801 domain-containing protein [Candidatus Saccharimonadales bacterium]|nr:DUF1801 domain-containing protein [Candidatus Saccharimonadales bacterium]